jgi:rubrerythrin
MRTHQPSDDESLKSLQTLAQLGLDAAAAYEIVANRISTPGVHHHLLEFQADHLRHVDALNTILSRRGGAQAKVRRPPRAEESLLRALAEAASLLSAHAALMAVIANERLTNGSYETALRMNWDPEVARVIERTLADERRHLTLLMELQGEIPGQELPQLPG